MNRYEAGMTSPQSAPRPVVLVVDDDPINLMIIREVLDGQVEWVPLFVRNGEEAIRTAFEQRPALVLLDIEMPGMKGYDVCRILKDNPDTADIPIIYITAKATDEDVIKGFKSGAVDYITKPFRATELIARVRTHLRLYTALQQQKKQSTEQGQREAWFKALYLEAPVSILIHDKDTGEIVDANPCSYEAYDYDSLDALRQGHGWGDPPYSGDDALKWIRRTVAEGPQTFEWKSRKVNGDIFWEKLCLRTIELDGCLRVMVVGIDITDRKDAEERLLHQQQRLQGLLDLPRKIETLSEAEFMQFGQELAEDLTGSKIAFIHFVNDDEKTIELVAWSRRTLEKYCNVVFAAHYPVDDAGLWAEALRQRAPVVVNDYATSPGRRGLPEGHSVLKRLISVPVMEQGRVVMLAGVGNKDHDYNEADVDSVQVIANAIWQLVQRKRGDVALKASEKKYRALFDEMREGFVLHEALYDEQGAIGGFRIIDANQAFERATGLVPSAITGRTLQDVLPGMADAFFPMLVRVVNDGEAVTVEHWINPLGRYLRLTAFRPAAGQVAVVCEDVSSRKAMEAEREQMQAKLMQVGKLEAVGQLAAGIAHEINNPLQFINDNTVFVQRSLRDVMAVLEPLERLLQSPGDEGTGLAAVGEEIKAAAAKLDLPFFREEIPLAMDQALEGILRIAAIVKAMREFSHPDANDPVMMDLNMNIRTTVAITKSAWTHVADLELTLQEELPHISGFPGALNQVFTNIIINAAQAIEERLCREPEPPGRIEISSGVEEAFVAISISDNGGGISPAIQKRVYDPFFTTKEIGKGTGQGLSIARNIIVKEHGGEIVFETDPGHGTTFIIRLPLPAPVAPRTMA